MKCYFEYKELEEVIIDGKKLMQRKKCDKPVYPDSYWCSKTHQIAWQEERYGGSGEHKPKLSIEQMQKRLIEMKKNVRKLPLDKP